MRLKKYLQEQELDIPIEEIISDCKPFLKEVQQSNFEFLYSGRMSGEKYKERKVRKDRKPKDTPEEIHNLIDSEFKRKFGVKARSQSLFAFKSEDKAKFYGDPFIVFPKGKYMLIYSKEVGDLYNDLVMSLNERYGTRSMSLLNKFKESDELVWNYNLETYEVPEEPGKEGIAALKGQHQDKSKTITKDEFMEDVGRKVENLVNTFEKTTSLADIPDTMEIMIVTSEVWLVHGKKVDQDELIDQIEQAL